MLSKASFVDHKTNIFKMSNTSFLQAFAKQSMYEGHRDFSLPAAHKILAHFPLSSQMKEMRQAFGKFDSNREGKISKDEYRAIMRALGQENNAGEVNKIFQVIDLDGDGFINFEEFAEAQKNGGVRAVDIHSAFHTFDRNGDGKMRAEEVIEVLLQLGERCSLVDGHKTVRAVDGKNGPVYDHDDSISACYICSR